MANGKIDASIIEESAFKRFDALLKKVDEGIVKLNEFQKSGKDAFGVEGLNELQKQQAAYTKTLQQSTTEELAQIESLKERARQIRALERENQKTIQTNTATNKSLREQQIIRRNNNRLIDLEVKATNKSLGAYTNLRAQVQLLEKEYLDLAAAGRLNTAEGRRLTAELEEQRDKLVQVNQAAGNFRDNVGNYPTALGPAITAIKQFAGALGLIEAFRFAKDAVIIAQSAKGVEFAFENLGADASLALDEVREKTRGLLSDLEIKQALVEFDNLNIELDKSGVAFEFLAVRAAQTGESIEKLRGDLVTGLGRESAKVLDNLGLDFNELKTIADETGGSIRSAFAVLAEREIAEAGDILDDTTNEVDSLSAAFKNLQLTLGQILDGLQVVEGLSGLVQGINGYFREVEINSEATNLRLQEQETSLTSIRATLARIVDVFRIYNAENRAEDAALVNLNKRRLEGVRILNEQARVTEALNTITRPATEAAAEENAKLAESIFDLGFSVEENKEKQEEGLKVLQDTVAFYQQQVRTLTELRDKTAQSTEEYDRFNIEIGKSLKAISDLKNGIDTLQEVEAVEVEVKLATDEAISADLTGLEDDILAAQQRRLEREQQLIDTFRTENLANLRDFTAEETKVVADALDAQKNLRENLNREILKTTQVGLSSIFDARVEAVDREIEANRDQLDQIVKDDTLSEEQKLDARRAFAEEEKRLQEERRKREREAFLVQQGLALAQVAIDLAKAISAINAISFTLPPVASEIYRSTNIPRAITTAALQTAAIASQVFPAFFDGKSPLDNYQGLATVNELPGQREVLIDPYGGVEYLPEGMHLRYLKAKDIIMPSYDSFKKEMAKGSGAVFNRVHNKIKEDYDRGSNLTEKGIEKAMSRALRKSNFNIENKVVIKERRRGYLNGRKR